MHRSPALFLALLLILNVSNSLYLGTRHSRVTVSALHLVRMSSSPLTRLFSSESDRDGDLDDLFDSISDTDTSEVSEEVQRKIQDSLRANAPSETEVRMDMLGLTPLTIRGFILAGIILICNFVFGAGWLGDLLGMNSFDAESQQVSISRSAPSPRLPAQASDSSVGSRDDSPNVQKVIIRTIPLRSKEYLLNNP